MPRTRVKKKQQSEDDERKKHLEEYLVQFDLQLENELTRLNRQAECVCNSVRTFFAVQRMGLDKNLLEMSFKDFIENEKNEKRENKSSSEIRSTKQSTKKKNVHSVLKTRSASQQRSKNNMTPKQNTRALNPNVFTPKFDPRKPITPAVGLRSIKPGEKFIMMSVSGSPLSGSPLTELVADADGKTIHVTTDMPVPSDLDEDTKNKICMIQKELARR